MAAIHQKTTSGTCESKFIRPLPTECRLSDQATEMKIMALFTSELLCRCFRVIIDEADDDRFHSVLENENSHKAMIEICDSENTSNTENPLARIRRFQIEAESRKIEFARLLEEHAQVIRQLKQMEETVSSHHFANTMTNVSKA